MISPIKEKWLFRILMLYFAFTILCLFMGAISRAFGNGDVYVRYILYTESIIVIPLLSISYKNYHKNLQKGTKSWIYFVMIYLLLEIFNTLLFSEIHSGIMADAVFWLFFVSVFFIGANERFWGYILKYSFVIVFMTMMLSAFELITMDMSYIRGQRDQSSYIYDIQLGFESITILLVYFTLTKQKKETVIAAISFAFYFMLQIYFQKRLPLLRMLLLTIMYFGVVKKYMNISRMTGVSIVTLGALLIAFSFVPDEYYEATYNRFFNAGSISKTAETDERYLISEKAISITAQNPRTLIIGNGLGSYLIGDFYGKLIPVGGRMVDGIGVTEIGFVTCFMRYGLVFIILIYGKLLKLLCRHKMYRKNPLAEACWVYLFVFTLMSIIGESFPYVNTPFHTLLVAASMGYLSSVNIYKPHHHIC